MLKSFVRSCSLLAAAVVSVAIAAPAFAQATPQATLDALEAANAKRAIMGLITPEGQKRLARETVMNGLMLLVFMDPDDPNPMGPKPTGADLAKKREAFKAAKASITAALKPSGLDAAIGKPIMPAEKIVDEKIGAADGAANIRRGVYGRPGSRHEGSAAPDEAAAVHQPQGRRRSRDREVRPPHHEDRQDRRQVAGRRPPARSRAGPVARKERPVPLPGGTGRTSFRP